MISTGKNLDSKNNSDDFRQFQEMLFLTKEKLQRDNPNGYQKLQGEFWKRFEIDVFHSMKNACFDLNLDWNIEHLGGHKFPDIIAKINQQRSFGVEVKTLSQSNENWNVMGGSIMETTAEKDVSRIHVFCAKKNPFEIKYRPFEDCVKDVAITHSPRYMLDLEMPSEQCLFKKSISHITKFEHWTILFPLFANICSLKSAEKVPIVFGGKSQPSSAASKIAKKYDSLRKLKIPGFDFGVNWKTIKNIS